MAYTPKYQKLLEDRRVALREQMTAFVEAGRIVLEVGCGHGHFLTAYAAAHPDRVCVGVDLLGERIERATKKRDRARLTNLHFIQAEARLFLETLPATVQLSTIFILFPDPWPKLRHNKHRIIQPEYLANLARAAEPDCPLYFRTDYQPYFAAAREDIASNGLWQLTEEPWPFEFETVFQQRAETYHSLVARCKRHAANNKLEIAALNAG